MATQVKSRWADNEEDVELENRRKQEKEEKRRIKAEKQKKHEEAASTSKTTNGAREAAQLGQEEPIRPTKRRKLSPQAEEQEIERDTPTKLLRFPAPEWGPCRHVDNFEKLNHIEEGSYGWVSRAREIATGEVVALKKLKMDNSNDGFPVTGLREIQTLMESRHENIVNLREVVMGDNMTE